MGTAKLGTAAPAQPRTSAYDTPNRGKGAKGSSAATAGFLGRWNLALGLASGGLVPGFRPYRHRPAHLDTPDAVVGYWIATLLHRPMLPAGRALVHDFLTGPETAPPGTVPSSREMLAVALILASPYFQWR